ncbi:MAG: OmpH family outer membrane protein [Pseudomonadota bacterium]
MKKLLISGILACMALVVSPAWAESKVGYVDLQQVVDQSAYSQRLREKIKEEMMPTGQEIQALSAQVQQLTNKLRQDGMTMQKSDRQKLERNIRSKSMEAKLRQENFREETKMREQEALSQVSQRAIEEVEKIAQGEGYNLVVHSDAVIYATEAIDLTDQVAKAMD